MKVKIEGMDFSESGFTRRNNYWKAQTLYDFAKAKEYKVMDMPLWCVNLGNQPLTMDSLKDFIFHVKRINDCSLDNPIILDDEGNIADGIHRICKAILNGEETIKAIRLEEMPAPDEINEEEE